MISTTIIITLTFAYLIGSIPGAILICKILHFPDPRTYGSKNPGATNTLRLSGPKIATIVILFDILKGVIPILLGQYLNISSIYLGIIAILTCLGHIYPIFFNFQGGKGVATAFGALTTISLDLSGVMISTWILTVLLFRYASLGAIITALIMPCYTWYTHSQYLIPIIIISSLVLIRHFNNIKRLWNHQEHHIWPL